MTTRSPFLVRQDFLSDSQCEKIISLINSEGDKIDPQPKTERYNVEAEQIVFTEFKKLVPEIEEHFGIEYRACERAIFQTFKPHNSHIEPPHCANSVYKRKKWVKVVDRDITGILWLNSYNDSTSINPNKNVYGGKLEFPQYGFSFQPQAGTLVMFPAYPHFIMATSHIEIGTLNTVRLNVAAKNGWLYQPDNFQGDYRVWFNDIV